MSDLRTAAQQALEALENVITAHGYEGGTPVRARDALRAALAEPVQEPKRKPLTVEEIVGHTCECVDDGTFNLSCAVHLARAIERAHGIGGSNGQ